MNEERDLDAPASYGEIKEGLLGGAGMILGAAYETLVPDPIQNGLEATLGFVGEVTQDLKDSAKPGYTGNWDPGKHIVGAGLNTMENFVQGASNIGGHTVQALGGDPEIGSDIGAVAGGLVLDKGLGKAFSAANNLQLPPPNAYSPIPVGITPFDPGVPNPRMKGTDVMQITVKNPDYLAKGAGGARQGYADLPEFAGWRKKYEAQRTKALEKMGILKKEAGGSTGTKKPDGEWIGGPGHKYKNHQDVARGQMSTGPTLLDDNPISYKGPASKAAKKQAREATGQKLQEHHLFSKMESNEFVRRMEEVGDMDDIVNMFIWAEESGNVMGNRLKDMLLTEKIPHLKGHSRRIKAGFEVSQEEMRKKLLTANSADEVMALLQEHLQGNVAVSKQDFVKMQSLWDEIFEASGRSRDAAKQPFLEAADKVPMGG